MRIFFQTLGCKVNQYETAAMKKLFADAGHTICSDPKTADVCVVNSCTVTSTGDQKSVKALRSLKNANPNCISVLCGCYVQAFPDEAASVQADIICGTKNRAELVGLVERFTADRHQIVSHAGFSSDERFEKLSVADLEHRTRAYIKIEDGCERFCAYCIVPYARGPVRSMPLQEIISEAETLAKSGYKELVITGINLCFYGRDMGISLADAVEAVCSVKGIERVRLSSVEPDMMTDDILNRLAAEPKFCPHFHMSIQSGCDATLSRMGRHYTTSGYRAIADTIRRLFDEPSFTTDIIVGFPGETEEEFAITAEFVRSFGFLKCHIFPYSRRSGTPAAEMENQIPDSIKKQRAKSLSAIADEVRRDILLAQIGKRHSALAERKQPDDSFDGFTTRYFPVLIKNPGVRRGDIVEGTAVYLADGALVIE